MGITKIDSCAPIKSISLKNIDISNTNSSDVTLKVNIKIIGISSKSNFKAYKILIPLENKIEDIPKNEQKIINGIVSFSISKDDLKVNNKLCVRIYIDNSQKEYYDFCNIISGSDIVPTTLIHRVNKIIDYKKKSQPNQVDITFQYNLKFITNNESKILKEMKKIKRLEIESLYNKGINICLYKYKIGEQVYEFIGIYNKNINLNYKYNVFLYYYHTLYFDGIISYLERLIFSGDTPFVVDSENNFNVAFHIGLAQQILSANKPIFCLIPIFNSLVNIEKLFRDDMKSDIRFLLDNNENNFTGELSEDNGKPNEELYSLDKILVGGYSSGGVNAIQTWNIHKKKISELYLFDPADMHSITKDFTKNTNHIDIWIKNDCNRRLRIFWGLETRVKEYFYIATSINKEWYGIYDPLKNNSNLKVYVHPKEKQKIFDGEGKYFYYQLALMPLINIKKLNCSDFFYSIFEGKEEKFYQKILNNNDYKLSDLIPLFCKKLILLETYETFLFNKTKKIETNDKYLSKLTGLYWDTNKCKLVHKDFTNIKIPSEIGFYIKVGKAEYVSYIFLNIILSTEFEGYLIYELKDRSNTYLYIKTKINGNFDLKEIKFLENKTVSDFDFIKLTNSEIINYLVYKNFDKNIANPFYIKDEKSLRLFNNNLIQFVNNQKGSTIRHQWPARGGVWDTSADNINFSDKLKEGTGSQYFGHIHMALRDSTINEFPKIYYDKKPINP